MDPRGEFEIYLYLIIFPGFLDDVQLLISLPFIKDCPWCFIIKNLWKVYGQFSMSFRNER